MSVSLKIVTYSPSLDMFGDPDASSAYSLSGHVSIFIHASPFSLFEQRTRTTAYLLKSLVLTFDGHSELIVPRIGYSGLRLCSITKDLVLPSDPVELSNEGQEDTTCRWDIVFNIPVPGWLPATTQYGIDEAGIQYHLEAEAVLIPIEGQSPSSSWSLSALCASFRATKKTLKQNRKINLRRYIDTQFLDSTEIPETMYLVNSCLRASPQDVAPVPEHILSKIQVIACVPEYVDVDSGSVGLTIRVRSQGLDTDSCRRLQLTGFSMDVVQREKCRFQPSEEVCRRYAMPPQSEQPPNQPLRNGIRGAFLYDSFYSVPANKDATYTREVSLLHADECGEYKLVGDCHIFVNDANKESKSWYTLQTKIPVLSEPEPSMYNELEWIAPPQLHASSSSPLLSFHHEVQMTLSCSYDLEDGEVATGSLTFAVPLKFSHVPPPPPAGMPAIHLVVLTQAMHSPPSNTDIFSESSVLPAYSQLFYSNGDRKLDATPLPLYTSRDTPDSPILNSSPELSASSSGKLMDTSFDSNNDSTETTTSLISVPWL